MVQRTRLRVDHVEHVALDEDSARAAEHVARLEVLPVLIEDLQAVVAAIGHPQAALRVEGERMRGAELAVAHADGAPRLDELAVGRELADAARRPAREPVGDLLLRDHALRVVAVGDVDAAVRSDDDVVGLVELAVGIARLARDTKAQELLAARAELMDLVPLGAGLVALPSHPCRSSRARRRSSDRT